MKLRISTLSVQISAGDIVAHMMKTWVYLLFYSVSRLGLNKMSSVSETPQNQSKANTDLPRLAAIEEIVNPNKAVVIIPHHPPMLILAL